MPDPDFDLNSASVHAHQVVLDLEGQRVMVSPALWAHYRKKPVVIAACQMPMAFKVKTLEGEMSGDAGDWLIRGVKNEFYPCKPDIFTATYEAADGPRRLPIWFMYALAAGIASGIWMILWLILSRP